MADNIRATPRNEFLGLLADAMYGGLEYMKDPRRTQQMQGLAGLLESTGIPKTTERMAYGEPLTNIGSANVPLLKPETAEAMMTVAPMVGPAARTAQRAAMSAGRAGERLAERVVPQVMERGGMGAGLLDAFAPQPSFATAPKMPINQMRESFVPGVEAGKEMIVHHNISPAKLARVEKVGGMPVPSLAVSNVENPMMNFGDISLIGSKEMAIPSAKNPVYGFDAYTARTPRVDYDIDPKSRKALAGSLKDIAAEIPDGDYGVDRLINNWEDRQYSDILKAKFLKDEGYGLPDINQFKDEQWRYGSALNERVNSLGGKYSDWLSKYESSLPESGVNIKERIFKGFTDSGNRRYAPVTLENLVKDMKGGAGAEGFFYGVGNIRAVATPKFRTLNQVKAARENIVTAEKFEPIKKKIDSAFNDLNERLGKLEGQSGYGYQAPDALYEVGQTGNVNLLDKLYKDVPKSLKADVQIFMSKLREMPTEYFEIKPQRAMQVGEFKGAILPSSAPQKSIDYLRNQGLQDLYYYSTPEERKNLFKKFGSQMFAATPAIPLGSGLFGQDEDTSAITGLLK
jgi:hypothetical protein